jgi:dienelactone hydrolase
VRFAFLLAVLAGVPPQETRSGGDAVLDLLQERAREALAGIERTTDRAGIERAAPRLREQLRASLGLARLPEAKPRNVRPVGVLDRGAVVIEKLVYETLPGTDVPAHLYRPARIEGKAPAVLFVPGHWYADSKTKTDFQAFCATLAGWGFVVLAYDPFGQGERGISLRDHRRTELLLAGIAQQAIVDFESSCALEVLRSRPDVDPARIGITGASGGGYNSWIMAALDPRIAVSVPVVGTSEFHEQLRVVLERDWYDAKEHCHFVPRLLRFANNHEFVAMIAPRPLLVIAANNDHSFRIPGNRAVAEYARQVYASFGAPEKAGYFEDETEGHGYQKKKREAAYGWFRKWLQGVGDGAPIEEPALRLPAWDAPELRCFPPGGNRAAGPGLHAVAAAALHDAPRPKLPISSDRLGNLLGLDLPPRLTSAPKPEREDSRVRFRIRDGIDVPGVLHEPAGPWKGAVLAAADGGKESVRAEEWLREGRAVVAVDIRGTGELAHGKPGWVFATSLLLGENFVGRQAMDLVGAWRSLYALPELRGRPIVVSGSGPQASLAALYAAVLEPRVHGVVLDGGFVSFRDLVERPKSVPASYTLAKPGEERTVAIDREIWPGLYLFDALRNFDLPDLVASIAPRAVVVRSAIDGDFATLSAEEIRKRVPETAGELRATEPSREIGRNPSALVPRGGLPARVHVAEDFETDIERRWWLAGRVEPGFGGRVCRGTLANDFDDKMGDPARIYTAVIFNPVPGPPMGPNTRLAFRYWLKGTDQLRVQIYSLSNGYHRQLLLSGLPQGEWREGCVDMTRLRRPDGSGGPLGNDERIDDVQFYTDPNAELIIDDIVLYDAAAPEEKEGFPAKVVFAGGFDTGRQGKEWPGQFEVVAHEKPLSWKGARSVVDPATQAPVLRVGLRGARALPEPTVIRFRYLLKGADSMKLQFTADPTHPAAETALSGLKRGEWAEARIRLAKSPSAANFVRFALPAGAELVVDDLLLYGPGE